MSSIRGALLEELYWEASALYALVRRTLYWLEYCRLNTMRGWGMGFRRSGLKQKVWEGGWGN